METCLHIDAPLFPSMIDPTDPTELQRRRQAFSQSTARRWTWSPHRSGPTVLVRGHAAFPSFSASTDWSPRLQALQQLSRDPDVKLSTAICVHVCIQIPILGVSM